MMTLVTYFPVCFAVSFVCTAVKESDDSAIGKATLKLFAYIVFGILAFAIVVQLVTALLG